MINVNPIISRIFDNDELGHTIFSIRWLLVPMYLLLWIAMLAYNVHFVKELIAFLFQQGEKTSEDYLIWILGLLDITMVANLLVMTTIGGYSTFVREIKNMGVGVPKWMNGIDSNTLKIKMGMSLVGVSAVHLLTTFMKSANVSWDQVWKEVIIHSIFIITTLAFTYNAYLHTKEHLLLHPPEEHHA